MPLLLPRAHTLTMDSWQGNVLVQAFAVIRSTDLCAGTGECAGIRVVMSVGWCRVSRLGAYSRHAAGDARVSPGCCVVVRTGTWRCAGIWVVLSALQCRTSRLGAHLCRVAGDAHVSSSCCVGWDTGTGGWARRWLMPAGRGTGDVRMRAYLRVVASARVQERKDNAATVPPAPRAPHQILRPASRPTRATSPSGCDPRATRGAQSALHYRKIVSFRLRWEPWSR